MDERKLVEELLAEIERLKRWVPRPEDMSGWNLVEELLAEIERLKRWVPRPEDMSGWNDPDAPEEVLQDIAEACRIHGVAPPPHVQAAITR